MTIDELIHILDMQEEILQFTHFTNADAWELGNLIVQESRRRNMPVALTIQRSSGQRIFQYEWDGTSLYQEEMADKKADTVCYLNQSTLRFHMEMRENEGTIEDQMAAMGVDPERFSGYGGGFPIRIEEAGVIGAVAVSGGNHVTDHDLLVKCISKYLHIDEVPRIRAIN